MLSHPEALPVTQFWGLVQLERVSLGPWLCQAPPQFDLLWLPMKEPSSRGNISLRVELSSLRWCSCCPERWWGLLGDLLKPPGCGPVLPALGGPAGAGVRPGGPRGPCQPQAARDPVLDAGEGLLFPEDAIPRQPPPLMAACCGAALSLELVLLSRACPQSGDPL